jgi:hypothetical protein
MFGLGVGICHQGYSHTPLGNLYHLGDQFQTIYQICNDICYKFIEDVVCGNASTLVLQFVEALHVNVGVVVLDECQWCTELQSSTSALATAVKLSTSLRSGRCFALFLPGVLLLAHRQHD